MDLLIEQTWKTKRSDISCEEWPVQYLLVWSRLLYGLKSHEDGRTCDVQAFLLFPNGGMNFARYN